MNSWPFMRLVWRGRLHTDLKFPQLRQQRQMTTTITTSLVQIACDVSQQQRPMTTTISTSSSPRPDTEILNSAIIGNRHRHPDYAFLTRRLTVFSRCSTHSNTRNIRIQIHCGVEAKTCMRGSGNDLAPVTPGRLPVGLYGSKNVLFILL